ncbi:hypothetical protein EDC01DRAFT_660767 [Geopyxis carbonaria]|nr:hypothetical protein EDC01DRAFT_660767 [Geopyxis carbonaria]
MSETSNNPFISYQDKSSSDQEFAPPPHPPPPKVPSGWVARWNERYGQFFYVNLTTKQSQWEVPEFSRTASPIPEKPPSYQSSAAASPQPPRGRSENPADYLYQQQEAVAHQQNQQTSNMLEVPDQQQANRSRSSSLGSKLSKFIKSHSPAPRPQYYTPPPSHYYGVAHPQQMYGPPPPQPMVYGGSGYGGGRRKPGMGGMAAGAGLGLGGGLLGGMLIGDMMNDHEQNAYQDGFEDGADYGGGDDFGGDMGGDF